MTNTRTDWQRAEDVAALAGCSAEHAYECMYVYEWLEKGHAEWIASEDDKEIADWLSHIPEDHEEK